MTAAVEAVLRGLGRELLEWRATGATNWRREGTQVKADADRRAHDRLAAALHALEPGTPIVSEEDPPSLLGDRPARYWLIDPIDGTASFVGGFAGFVTQVAMMDANGPVAGWVHAPATDEMFTAERGAGATRDGRPLLTKGRAATSALVDNYPEPRGLAKAASEGLGLSRYVESGSLGLKICRVADGTADLFLKDVRVSDWDLAPGHLILVEAGGRFTDVRGCEIPYRDTFTREGIAAAAWPDLHVRFLDWHKQSFRASESREKGKEAER